jgi:TonB-dependent receptor
MVPSSSLAQTTLTPLYLQSQPLADSLHQLSNQFGESFVVANDDLAGLYAPSISGQHTFESALSYLLKATPLTFERTTAGIVIHAKDPVSEASVMEEVAVTGIRASLNESRRIKREHHVIADVVATTDIASYPDRNLAESLQRIPGIAITREAGEGRQVSLRGLNPDFTLVTLNGMPVLANNDSPMDSRMQKQRDRSFDLNLFATELFNQIQVLKSYSPELPSGGMAGIAALSTAHPFDNTGLQWSVTQQLGKNEFTTPLAKRSSAMISATNDHWGALFSLTYGERVSLETGANTFRWREITPEGADISALDDDLAAAWQAGELRIPRGNRYSVWRSDMTRLGLGLALEYRSDSSHITLDWLFGQLSGDRYENHLYPRGYLSTPVIEGMTIVTDAEINNSNELVYAAYEQARVGTESRYQRVSTTYSQWVINASHRFNKRLTGRLLMGTEQASYDIPASNKAYMKGITDVTIDYRHDAFFADINYADDLTQPSFWQMQELDSEAYFSDTKFHNIKASLSYRVANGGAVDVGIDYLDFTSTSTELDIQNMLANEWEAYASGVEVSSGSVSNVVADDTSYVMRSHPRLHWLALNTNAVFNAFGVPTTFAGIDADNYTLDTPPSSFNDRIDETQWAGFIRGNTQQGNWNIDGGVRVQYETIDVWDDLSTTINDRRLSHIHLLPALNLIYTATAPYLYRLSLSRSLGKPALDDLARAVTFDTDTNILYGFNNHLTSYSSYNVDLAFETYSDGVNRTSLSLFAKYMDDYIVATSQTMLIEETPEYDYWLADRPADGTLISRVAPQNAEHAYLYGIEASAQLETRFDLLPGFHFGVIANISYSQGQVRYFNTETGEALTKKALPYLSPWLANITAYIENYGFSTRLSATYRDRYLARIGSQTAIDEDETGFNESIYIDAVVAYPINDHWEIRVEASNLSNEREEQYSDSSLRAYNTTYSGRNYYIGVTYRH